MARLEIKNLKYRYPYTDRLALDGITCTIEPGEFIGVIGKNESGKNTFTQVLIGLENLGVPREEMHKRIKDAMKLLDIKRFTEREPFALSGGQMQRMAIASIIAMNPEVIILDEPTSQLDPQGSEEVFKAVQALSQRGITVIMVEHKIEKVAAYSDKVMLLDDGKLIDFDTPQKVFSRDDLEEHGVQAPAFARIGKGLGVRHPKTNMYPVTLEEAKEALAK